MRINKAGNQRSTCQIDNLSLTVYSRTDLFTRAH